MNHQQTYDKVCKAQSIISDLLFELISDKENWVKIHKLSKIMSEISDSEHEGIIQDIKTGTWKP